ncbi:ABC-type Mn2+/Zn2+ transport system, permease component [Desulfocapsa sulfexigens DSM 10523]|uniref:ABC-type Mn2+/Zn2+ transport system, permease component n=1 Tax=Desulfocapsa sulfexigens (strain DSM 10523 / SB164P1) TaxID=1167006 RepID=M1P4J6_DESSD|nr:metal ABC transporter permease [Desulfocapsa sulfexigens]AGF78403.1 ABC-type Mn2+/Zn2+ transport system, permease component [Desulfocapsa sulfexigens DSM 10523]
MIEFVAALTDPNLPFFRYALLTGIFASVPFGIIGTFVVVRRISYIAGAIAHCVLGGIGLGMYLEKAVGISWFGPMQGAVLVALLAAVILTLVSRYAAEREDSVIGALWAVGMATGLLFIAKTPGYVDPMSYLFGNILLVSKQDFVFVLVLDVIVLGLVTLFYNKFLAVCFDEEFSRLRGVHTGWMYLLLLCLAALTIVLLVRVVGIVMVIALLTLPAAVAGNMSRNIKQMMFVSILFCAGFVVMGLGVSYNLDLPSGPVIIVIAALVYLLVLSAARLKKSFF